jgi:rare lipoprotein A
MIRCLFFSVFSLVLSFSLICYLTSCAVKDGPPKKDVDVSHIPDAVPQQLPRSKYGNNDYTSINGVHYHILDSADGYEATGMASWYGTKFDGQLTSSRETYHMLDMTAAHRTLPLPCFVRVTNLSNGLSVIVKVNDRGPFKKDRLIDLSYAAAKKLGFHSSGTGLVRVTAINSNDDFKLANPATDSKSFYLQVAAFHIKENALQFKEKLSNETDYPIMIEEAKINGNPLYRIQVGPIKDIQDSLSLKKNLHLHNLM